MTKQNMGSKISILRKEQGMTQAELAEKMNVTDKAVSKWERNLSCPEVNSLPRLAEIFGISVDELMAADNTLPGDTDADQIDRNPAGGDLAAPGAERAAAEQPGDRTPAADRDSILDLILKVIPLAMGIAVTVLSIMKEIDLNSGFQLLGIGLTCVGIGSLRGKRR